MVAVNCRKCGEAVERERQIPNALCEGCSRLRKRETMRDFNRRRRNRSCPDCGAAIMDRSVRCLPCENKVRGPRYQGDANPNWKGGRHIKEGYIYVRRQQGTPGKGKGAFYRPEHHEVWERVHGRTLPKSWVIHHLNGVKGDNRPENLAAMPHHEHHSHPRKALRPYEARIHRLEQELAELQQLRLVITH